MLVLGIESSCDETAAAVVENGRILVASTVASQMEMHARYGGVFPEVASREHVLKIVPVLSEAVERAGVAREQSATALLDYDIKPDQGSINPFIPGELVNAANRSYTVTVLPDGTIAHAALRIGDSIIEMGEAHAEFAPMAGHFHVQVDVRVLGIDEADPCRHQFLVFLCPHGLRHVSQLLARVDAAQLLPVGMKERLNLQAAAPLDLVEEGVPVVPRIDDHRLLRGRFLDDVGVDHEGPDLHHVDAKGVPLRHRFRLQAEKRSE